ncbi:hypothetical protein [Kistimonas asteriae]|uniref:hypothetical protein n=1 Tax=Kistimonas asteriae TaxID=517724 RepID=UPI001BABB9DF|nr:hypothetical protein [Kistimonas asteriae]
MPALQIRPAVVVLDHQPDLAKKEKATDSDGKEKSRYNHAGRFYSFGTTIVVSMHGHDQYMPRGYSYSQAIPT